MSVQLAAVFLVFAFSMALTPGPSNITLMGISNRFGFTAAMPFVAGSVCGMVFVFASISAGLVSVFERYPDMYTGMKYVGAGYLLYLAWGIASTNLQDGQEMESSPGFTAGAFIQLLNPKMWIVAMMALSQFADMTGNYLAQVVTIIVLFGFAGAFSNLSWAYFGSMLKRISHSPRRSLMINRCLGATLAVTVVFMVGTAA